MYKSYQVTIPTIHAAIDSYLQTNNLYCKITLAELETKHSDIVANIASLIQGDASGVIDGDAVREACMPTNVGEYDIFISHSHNDEAVAINLAVYLKRRYGLNCFVDGLVWGSCDENILKPIDKRWCMNNRGNYDYDKRNFSTSHVHSMLSMALLEMIDNCECAIFIKPSTDYDLTGIGSKTLSPWIYQEINMINKIERHKTKRPSRCTESFSQTGPRLNIAYKLDLSDMPQLKVRHLDRNITITDFALSKYTAANAWLDYIYDNVK